MVAQLTCGCGTIRLAAGGTGIRTLRHPSLPGVMRGGAVSSGHDHIDFAAPAFRTDQPIAPIEKARRRVPKAEGVSLWT
jgi:hypothetical protein